MKSYFVIVVTVLTAALFIMSCGGDKQAEPQEQAAAQQETGKVDVTPDMLTTNIDVACGMDLTQHAIADTAIYNGQLYGFCSEYCKNKFKEDPEAALASLNKKENQQDMHQH